MGSTSPKATSLIVEQRATTTPFFSICIPQYSRYPFLLEQLEALSKQTFRNYEVCISDDLSKDQGRSSSIVEFLRTKGINFAYAVQSWSQRYDANLRAAIDLAQGDYLVLMGNDDRLENDSALELLHRRIVESSPVSVVVTNYQEIPTGRVFERVLEDGLVGSGVGVAATTYRNYAFVSGLVLQREAAFKYRTEDWDGSEMYQMYLGSRMIAAGGRLLGVKDVLVLKDIQIQGHVVDSYQNQTIQYADDITERVLPMSQIPSLVWNAIKPFATPKGHSQLAWQVLKQMLLYTYPFWMVELRRVHSFRYAFEVCLGMRSRHLTKRMAVGRTTRWKTRVLHICSSAVGLTFPVILFGKLAPALHRLAKRC